jgi:hypothetical protein
MRASLGVSWAVAAALVLITACGGTSVHCRPDGERCGSTTCAPGMVCCNASCGVCTLPDQACTQQACEPPPAIACETDSDCRAVSDYCTGCDCRALSVCEAEPACPTPGVQCLVDPCGGEEAYCAAGTCALRPAAEACPPEDCGPALGMPNAICPDGETIAGPTGRCLRRVDEVCSWEVIFCPDRGTPRGASRQVQPAAGAGARRAASARVSSRKASAARVSGRSRRHATAISRTEAPAIGRARRRSPGSTA